MPDWWKNPFSCCTKEPPVGGKYTALEKGKGKAESSAGEDNDEAMWSRDLLPHAYGDFSIAAVQAGEHMEDQSQVEASQNATLVGVYDGHGGPDVSQYVCDNLFEHLQRLALNDISITEEVIMNAFAATEEGFLGVVANTMGDNPAIATIGSCCLVGLIWQGILYVANLGDSRAVMGYRDANSKIQAERLTDHHNASVDEIREQLMITHPEDPEIVINKDTVWRVKGIIQVTRAIGDSYLKRPEFAAHPSLTKFQLKVPIQRPVLRSDPSIVTRVIQQTPRFVIFASDGLWDHLSNEQAVDIGIAKRLLVAALTNAAHKLGINYSDLKNFQKGTRRKLHDDTSVVVLYIDSATPRNFVNSAGLSIRAFSDSEGPSKFVVEGPVVELK
ncbi:hypothetical protein Leryth_016232 [Lithospermum erythrorhizon]|nr:hypothetical protein Leryth_016232 [Lithospermum erythrorhizon]